MPPASEKLNTNSVCRTPVPAVVITVELVIKELGVAVPLPELRKPPSVPLVVSLKLYTPAVVGVHVAPVTIWVVKELPAPVLRAVSVELSAEDPPAPPTPPVQLAHCQTFNVSARAARYLQRQKQKP